MAMRFFTVLLFALAAFLSGPGIPASSPFVVYIADPGKQEISMVYRDLDGKRYGNLKNVLKSSGKQQKELLMAMNGGMYQPDRSPQGLSIEGGRVIHSLDTAGGSGNFYLKPNGVFFVRNDGTCGISRTEHLPASGLRFATQSGPMLLSGGKMHPVFTKGSKNLQIRNGVGILPDNRVMFAISREKVNFYEFAGLFKEAGCTEALYLDGYVSRAYIPGKGVYHQDGDFGVIITVTAGKP